MLLTSLFLFIEQPKTIIFIVLILVLFFGAKRIPEMMRGLGQGVREFKDATKAQPEQPMNPGGYASQNPNYPPAAAPYGQPVHSTQPQHPTQPTPGYQSSVPTAPATPYTAPDQQPLG